MILLPFATSAANQDSTCLLLDNRAAKCFGDNTYGQLGLPSPTSSTSLPNTPAGGDTYPNVSLGTGRLVQTLVTYGGYPGSAATSLALGKQLYNSYSIVIYNIPGICWQHL